MSARPGYPRPDRSFGCQAQRLHGRGSKGTPKKLERPGRSFLIRLARELGRTVEEIEQIDGDEASEWKVHFSQYPFTIDAIDEHLAQIAFILFNANSKTKRKIEDFRLIDRKRTTVAPTKRKTL